MEHVLEIICMYMILQKFIIKCLNKIKFIRNLELNCSYGKGYSVLDIVKSFEKIAKKKK